MYSPTPDQQRGIEWLSPRNFGCLVMDTGTGKTGVALSVLKAWHNVQRTIALVPRQVVKNWPKECINWDVPGVVVACRGTQAQRLKLIKSNWNLLVINHDAIRTPAVLDALLDAHADFLIVDEVHNFKTRTAARTKAAVKLRAHRAYEALRGALGEAAGDFEAPER